MSSIDGIKNSATGSVLLRAIESHANQQDKSPNPVTNTKADPDKTELSEMGKELSKITGKARDDNASKTPLNVDEDTPLGREKAVNMMKETMEQPPQQRIGGTNAQQAASTYLANSGEDQLSRLQQLMSKLSEDLSQSDDTTPTL